jgi:hypothetical protein
MVEGFKGTATQDYKCNMIRKAALVYVEKGSPVMREGVTMYTDHENVSLSGAYDFGQFKAVPTGIYIQYLCCCLGKILPYLTGL